MARLEHGYMAIFYAHGARMSQGVIRDNRQEAVQDILESFQLMEQGRVSPWNHAVIEEVIYPVYDE